MALRIIIPCVLILFSNFCGLHAQISPNISLGNSSIIAGSNATLLSLSGDFAFGFYALQSGLYLVGIWFERIPERTLVCGAAASSGTMENDGNFVLRDKSSKILWQSFDSPTDTLLPGKVLRSRPKALFQCKRKFKLLNRGFQAGSAERWEFVEDYYHRATVEDHGNFRQYIYHKRNGGGWKRVWSANNDPCFVTSICGQNGMCNSPDDETMSCSCLPGYLPIDPSDVSKGCYLENVVDYCIDPSMMNFSMTVIDDADFPPNVYDGDLGQLRNVDVEGCKKAVLDDCYTLAASWVNSTCLKKRMPLLSARKSASSKGRVAFIKVLNKKKSDEPGLPKRKNFDKRVLLVVGLIISTALAFLFGVLALFYHPAAGNLLKKKRSVAKTIGVNFREFTLQELREATNGFNNSLGQGASGRVYSGKLEMVVGHDPEVLSDFKRFERMALVGSWCIHPDPILRPSMKKVTQMLEGTMEVGIPPQVYDHVLSNQNY
uniref:EGF-like domain-containing protein n=1 Tax=Fagus sylvatica TaxID=28930 RepID=A0A2N9GFB7_FAGSY